MNRCVGDKDLPLPVLPEDKVRPVRIGCLDLFDNKMKVQTSSLKPSDKEKENPVIGCFDLYRKRMEINDNTDKREDSFNHSLKYSFNSERVKVVEKEEIFPHYKEEYLALITPDEKRGVNNLGISKKLLPGVGKLIYWCRTDSYWLITSEEKTEKAYFKGTIEECNYVLSWRDDKGNVYKQRVKMQGPVETKYKNEILGDFIGGKPNETNSIWLAKTENTKHLNRYDKLIMNGKGYEITVVNDVDSIIKINLIEGYINPDEDTLIAGEEISEGQIQIDYKVYTTIDGIKELPMKPFEFDVALFQNGVISGVVPIVTINGNAVYENGMIYPLSTGTLEIRVCFYGYPVDKIYTINIVEEEIENIYYEILGQDTVDKYSAATYQLAKNTNGNIEILDANLISILPGDENMVELNKSKVSAIATPKKIGEFTLIASIDSEPVLKKVKIINPW